MRAATTDDDHAAFVRAAGYEPLASFVGRWTVKGQEHVYVEACRWYAGGFHVGCNTERKRPDGSTGKGMSILGYLPYNDSYTYYGIGSGAQRSNEWDLAQWGLRVQ